MAGALIAVQEPMQMALPVTLPDDETFTSYFGGENSLEVSHLKDAFTKLSNKFMPKSVVYQPCYFQCVK